MINKIDELIVKKYPGPAWAVLTELRDGTGFSTAGRTADAVAFSLWPSRGLAIVGMEIKTSRSDWLSELKNPAKAESIAKYCNEFWLVTSENVAKEEEIPLSWGWYICNGKTLKVKKPAQQLTPIEINRVFLMSIMRNFSKSHIPLHEVKAKSKEMVDAAVANANSHTDHILSRAQSWRKTLFDFKEASGINLEEEWKFNAKEVGALVKAVMNTDLRWQIKQIASAAQRMKDVMAELESVDLFKKLNYGDG